MLHSLISLVSIILGIVGANLIGITFKNYSLGLTANSILGVFGSIFFIKTFGRLGCSPHFIVTQGDINLFLWAINTVLSFCGGVIFLLLMSKIKAKINKHKS